MSPAHRDIPSDKHRGSDEGLCGRLLAEAAVPRARSAVAHDRAGRGVWLSRAERRWKNHDAQAAHAAYLPDLGARRDPGPAGRRCLDPPADRLPSRESLVLRLSDRRGAARLLCAALRVWGSGSQEARGRAPRPGRSREGAPAAAAEVLQGDGPTCGHRPGTHQRSRGRFPR